MPTYDYECLKCKNQFEAFQKMTDKHLTACPRCNGKVRRLISPGSGLIFKGSGFFITDYKKKNTPDVSKKTTDSCSGCGDSSCPKSENKKKS